MGDWVLECPNGGIYKGKKCRYEKRGSEFVLVCDSIEEVRPCQTHQKKKRHVLGEYEHERIEPPEKFDPRSFRTKEVKKGTKIVVGCPKGKYDPMTESCAVGTRIQKIMRKV